MGTRLFLVGILIIASATAAYGFSVGSSNGAIYFIGGAPDVSSEHAAGGTTQVGAYTSQHASANNPGGIGIIGQSAGAVGGQVSGPHVQAQGLCGGMSQGTVKFGGSGYVQGTQGGTVGMTQGSSTGTAPQSMHATGMQYTGIYGNPTGVGVSGQNIHASTGQAQIH
jgi:hypothetical protein